MTKSKEIMNNTGTYNYNQKMTVESSEVHNEERHRVKFKTRSMY